MTNRNRPPRRWFIDWPLVALAVACLSTAAYVSTHHPARMACPAPQVQP